MNQNDESRMKKDLQQLEEAVKEAGKILKLLPTQERIDRVVKAIQQKEVDLDILPYSVASAIQQAEEAQKGLGRYIQLLKNFTR